MKKAKKGFTIVELVVVIAVIAILAAVLIPTFISIVNRAKVSNDNQLVRNLNTALITEEADGNKAENMSQAIEIAEDYGYKLENLQAKADGYVLLWNQTTNRFYVESAEGTITSNPEVTDFPRENYTYWEISKTLSEKHSTYLTEGSGDITATNLGVDVSGISSAVNVTYTGNENKVIIATNGGDFSVDAGTGHVDHYGFVKNLTVTAVNGTDCYREHGYVGTLATFGTGKFVAEKGSQFHQTKIEVEGKVITPNTFVDLGATYGVHRFDANGVCEIEGCNVTSDHNHVWGDWNKTEEKHSHTCSTCGGVESIDHIIENWVNSSDNTKHVGTCIVCQYQKSENHDTKGDNGACSVCGYVSDPCVNGHTIDENTYIVVKEQTCTETGTRLGKCTVCDNWIEETIPMHHYSSEWTGNNYNHWHYCVDCYDASNSGKSGTYSEKNGHDEKGENGTCSVCGYDNDWNYFANKCSHIMAYKKSSDKYHSGACKICGLNQIFSEAHDEIGEEGSCSKCGYKSCEHNVESWEVVTNATCLKDGEEQAVCSICEKTIKRKIPALGHTITNFTKTDIFNHTGLCDTCGESASEKHDYSEVSITGGEESKKYYKCDCGVLLEIPENYEFNISDLLDHGFNMNLTEWGQTTTTIGGQEYTVFKAVCNSGAAKGTAYTYLVPVN